MSASSKSVFLLGPGLVGRNVVDLLLVEGYSVTTLVRRESAAAELQKDGVKTIHGTLANSEVITKQTIACDIVFHIATADDLPSVQAVLEGVKFRAQAGQQTIYIHTSGTGLFGDAAMGQYKGERVYSDDKPHDIDALPDTAPHRTIDLTIIRARQELGSRVKVAIMIPPLIYGIQHKYKRLSIQLPTLARFALKHGYAGQVGEGRSVWSTIHVLDLARGYITLLHWLEKTSAVTVLENPYFFCESGDDIAWAEPIAVIGQALHAAGRIKDPAPKTIPEQDYKDLFGEFTPLVVGSNCRSRATRLRQLGWQPREKGVLESLRDDELPLLLQETGEFNGYTGVAAS
ncbi:hypothetical protein LTR84_009124 [Exophiala bonariae]|uniref:NAD(P)-binding domain-containing protein n=1 Tax=Exophiala bonariae TaxID=1690606 RepID=A0AAV9MVP6_9EURO|nr:hypothetical protein LTR84_009124 [Exophiala bonariae]